MTTRPLIVPSVLPANQARLGEACAELTAAGADRIQFDVMDGHFVPNLTFGPAVIADCRRETDLEFEAHLMVSNPDALLAEYVQAGCGLVIVHAETTPHVHRTLSRIRELGARAGLALNPHTPAQVAEQVLEQTDLVLVMTVNPGFGGQAYLEPMQAKVRQVRSMIEASGLPIQLEVDGGITDTTITGAAAAGADVFISGSWLFNYPRGKAEGIKRLRALAEGATR